jgi:hypothetical protein
MADSGQMTDPMTDPYGSQPGQPDAPMGPEPSPYGPEQMPIETQPDTITSGGVIAMVGGLMLIISLVLPWIDIPSLLGGSDVYTGFQTPIFGILTLIFAVLIIILALVKRPLGSGILGIISLIIVIFPLLIFGVLFGSVGVEVGLSLFSYGWYLALVGSILAIIGGIIGHKQM